MTTETFLLVAILAVVGFSAFTIWKMMRTSVGAVDPRMKADLEKRIEENAELKTKLEEALKEKNELAGKGRQMYDNFKNLESDNKANMKERDGLRDKVTKFETQQEQRQKKQEEMVAKLESAEKALADERLRIRHEDEERLAEQEAERDRLWNEHENNVISLMTDLCKKPQFSFPSYDNDNLPEGFHGNLKPDFLLEFLDQYVIFDAKVSKADSLQIYINDQVKKTVAKVKGKEKIYPTIFLVVPTHAIGEIKKTYYFEEGFHFFVICPEAIAPILASLKRIETYEFAEAWDPQEREAIIDLLAQFDYHISLRNYIDYHLMEHGLETLRKTQTANPEMAKEVAIRKGKMRALSLKTAEQKAFVANPELLQERLIELTEPKSQIQKEEIRGTKSS